MGGLKQGSPDEATLCRIVAAAEKISVLARGHNGMLPKYQAVPGNRHVERSNISVRADWLPDAHHQPNIISGP